MNTIDNEKKTVIELPETKPDFAEAANRWDHYWAGEVFKRPPVVATLPKPGVERPDLYATRYLYALENRWDEQLAIADSFIEGTLHLAEAVPYYAPDFGPDQFAAFYGATLKCDPNSSYTAWVDPIVDDWNDILPLVFDPENPLWQRMLQYSRKMAEHGKGRYIVGCCDFHSNADTLLALRGGERLCMDFYDCPDLIEKAMLDVRKAFKPVYEGLYEAGGMSTKTGASGWISFWCRDRYAVIQCDFICMVSPDIARKFIIPALEEEAAFLDHCIYHLDGPGALPHLDDILSIKDIDVIQWVSGAGQPPMHTWTDVLKKCQDAGKGLHLYCIGPEETKALHRELKPEGVVYQVSARTQEEVEDLCKWLEANT